MLIEKHSDEPVQSIKVASAQAHTKQVVGEVTLTETFNEDTVRQSPSGNGRVLTLTHH